MEMKHINFSNDDVLMKKNSFICLFITTGTVTKKEKQNPYAEANAGRVIDQIHRRSYEESPMILEQRTHALSDS